MFVYLSTTTLAQQLLCLSTKFIDLISEFVFLKLVFPQKTLKLFLRFLFVSYIPKIPRFGHFIQFLAEFD